MAALGLASRLKHKVTIQEPNVVDNGKGGRKPPAGEAAWRDVAVNVPAEVYPLRGGEALSLGVERATQIYRVTIRKRQELTPKHRLVWQGIALNIKTAPPCTDGQSNVMTCESGALG